METVRHAVTMKLRDNNLNTLKNSHSGEKYPRFVYNKVIRKVFNNIEDPVWKKTIDGIVGSYEQYLEEEVLKGSFQ